MDVAPNMGVTAQQHRIQLPQPLECTSHLLLVAMNVGHLLQGEPLQRHTLSPSLPALATHIQLSAQLGNVVAVVQLEVTAQGVFHRHGQHVA